MPLPVPTSSARRTWRRTVRPASSADGRWTAATWSAPPAPGRSLAISRWSCGTSRTARVQRRRRDAHQPERDQLVRERPEAACALRPRRPRHRAGTGAPVRPRACRRPSAGGRAAGATMASTSDVVRPEQRPEAGRVEAGRRQPGRAAPPSGGRCRGGWVRWRWPSHVTGGGKLIRLVTLAGGRCCCPGSAARFVISMLAKLSVNRSLRSRVRFRHAELVRADPQRRRAGSSATRSCRRSPPTRPTLISARLTGVPVRA